MKGGSFTVKSSYNLLEGGSHQLVPSKLLWNPCVPTKISFFAWEVWWGKILTMNQLKKRGFTLASRCPFCGEKEKVMEHIIIHCPKIWEVWTAIFSMPKGGWVFPYSVQDLIFGWNAVPLRKK